jgi:PIN domain nuclease of toxin-antitoxin system
VCQRSPTSGSEANFLTFRTPQTWIVHSLENFILLDISPTAALQAGLWPWSHGDLVGRSLAALAAESGITLVHTDKVLRDLEGFPQKWFKNVPD